MERHLNSIIEYKLQREAKKLKECSFQPNLGKSGTPGSSKSRRKF